MSRREKKDLNFDSCSKRSCNNNSADMMKYGDLAVLLLYFQRIYLRLLNGL
jgi:hypothetical protein